MPHHKYKISSRKILCMTAEKKKLSRRFWQRITRPAEINEMVQYFVLRLVSHF